MKETLRLSGLLVLVISLLLPACNSETTDFECDNNPDTDWFHEAKVGAFMHFLTDADNFDLVEKFDVVALANQLEKAGVKVFEITLGQNSGYYIAPNPVYDEISGYKSGERTSKRDLPMELAVELKKRDITLMLYLPCQTPNTDVQAITNFGFNKDDPDSDKYFTEKGVGNWSKVIAWWSKHYGDLVKGWWFDGGFTWCGFNWAVGKEYNNAVKTGNPHSIVTFNPGVDRELIRHCHAADYTAGETGDILLSMTTPGRWVEGAQAHVLTYIGKYWGRRDTRFSDDEIAEWTKEFTGAGGVVMFDVGPNYDEAAGPVGSISEEQLHQLNIAVKAAGL